MKAIAVHPGTPNSIHLRDIPEPSLTEIPDGRGVKVQVLRADVGVLLEPTTVAEKGVNQAYAIQQRLRVWEPQRACILGSGTVGLLAALVARLRGLELTVYSLPQKPYRNAELIEELGGVYVSSQERTLAEVSEERGPFDLMLDATGFSPIVWEAAEVLGKN